MIMRAAASWLLSCILATNSVMNSAAWQQWPPSRHNAQGSKLNKFERRGPSYIRYLDDDHFTYDRDAFDYESSSSDDVASFDSRKETKRKVHAKIKADAAKNVSFHNYPSHLAPAAVARETSSRDAHHPHRKRSRLAPRSANRSAILPTKRNNAKTPSSDLLTFEEEVQIAHRIKKFRAAVRVRDQLSDWMAKEVSHRGAEHRCRPSEEQWASACSLSVRQLHDVMTQGQEARTKLITGNIGLVTMIAKRYYNLLEAGNARGGRAGSGMGGGRGGGGTDATLKLEDLIQEGYIGIMDAAERFDPDKGFRFSTYGSHWVRQRILRSISESSRIIRLPVHVQTMLRNMNKKRKEFEQVVGRTPSLPELAHELGLSLEKVNLYQHLSRNVMSLEMQLDQHSSKQDNRERTLGDRIPCTELPTPDEDAMSEAFRREIHSMLDHLGDHERMVLTHRFGLEDGCPRTLRETSDSMGVSIDTVRGIEARALNKLRQPRMMYRLKDFVEGGRNEEGWENHYAMDSNGSGSSMEGHSYSVSQAMNAAVEQMNRHSMNLNCVAVEDGFGDNDRPTPESIWSF
ncbi:hypothetical protein ACHAWX_007089 [Stephanocyclus meneghinianus]